MRAADKVKEKKPTQVYNYKTAYIDVLLANQSYESDGGIPPKGWKVLDSYQRKICDELDRACYEDSAMSGEVGFMAVAYINETTQTITFAFRGTDNYNNFILPDADILLGSLPRTTKLALQYAHEIQAKYPDFNFHVTGHSLGASLATVVAVTKGWEAILFDSPGVGDPKLLTAAKGNWDKVCNFICADNLINGLNSDPIKTVKLGLPDAISDLSFTMGQDFLSHPTQDMGVASSVAQKTFDTSILSLRTHSLDNFIQFLSNVDENKKDIDLFSELPEPQIGLGILDKEHLMPQQTPDILFDKIPNIIEGTESDSEYFFQSLEKQKPWSKDDLTESDIKLTLTEENSEYRLYEVNPDSQLATYINDVTQNLSLSDVGTVIARNVAPDLPAFVDKLRTKGVHNSTRGKDEQSLFKDVSVGIIAGGSVGIVTTLANGMTIGFGVSAAGKFAISTSFSFAPEALLGVAGPIAVGVGVVVFAGVLLFK